MLTLTPIQLTPTHRRDLRALSHGIRPVVWIGTSGLSESVIDELDRALKSHELIKIKISGGEREAREAILEEICQRLGAAPVRHIGRILVIYRPKENEISGEITEKVKITKKIKVAMPRSRSTISGKKNRSHRIKGNIP
jgi:putative YhbY family RNA-binding protein